MIKEPTYDDLKKQIEKLQIDLAENKEKLKQTEFELEKVNSQNYQFHTALTNLDTFVFIKDSDRQYVYANEKTLQYFNSTAEEIVNCNDTNFFSPETCELLAKIDTEIITTGKNTAIEVEAIDNNGDRRVYWEVKTPIYAPNNKNKIIGLCGIATDITERKTAEETIRKSESQLKALNATKDKLFSIMAHDLRTPFINIIGVSELLYDTISPSEKDDADGYIDIINSTAKSTLALLDNLLSWARLQTGEICFRPELINLTEIIREIVTLNASHAKAKNITLDCSLAEEIRLNTDANILNSVLRNLISNAIKFTNQQGQINIAAKTVKEHVEISVSDNGIGMCEKTIESLFNLATNNTTPGTANEIGSGFGLILCKEFIEKLGGQVKVESKVGKGSTFIIKLPFN